MTTPTKGAIALSTMWRQLMDLAATVLFLAFAADALGQTPLIVTTTPNPPKANQPYQVSVSGNLLPNLVQPYPGPTVTVSGTAIAVFLNRDCGFSLCPGYGFSTQTFAAPPLPAGSYLMTVYQGYPPAPAVSLANLVGVLAFSVPAPNYTGLWWKAPAGSESGWGVSIEHQGDILFCVWYTYGADSNGVWLVAPNGAKAADGSYSGALYRTTGPQFNSAPWSSSSVVATPVGSATFVSATQTPEHSPTPSMV